MKDKDVKLTRGEANALYDAASQMLDDFEDYHSYLGKAKLNRHYNNFLSGLKKLSIILQSKPKINGKGN